MNLSIIIPIFKVESFLNPCIESIVSQCVDGDIEVILIDDGSPDSCPEICDAWASRDERVRVIHQDNGGLSSARNAGLDVAKGEYIWFLDSDDMLDSKALPKVLELLKYRQPDIIYGKFDLMDEDGLYFNTESTDRFYPLEGSTSVREVMRLLVSNKLTSHAWRFVAKNSLYTNSSIRFPAGMVYEDVATTYRIVSSASDIVFLDDVLVHYRQRAESILHSDSLTELLHFKDGVRFFLEREKFIADQFPDLIHECEIGTYRWLSGYAWELSKRLGDTPADLALRESVTNRLIECGKRCGIIGVPLRILIKTALVITGFDRIFS